MAEDILKDLARRVAERRDAEPQSGEEVLQDLTVNIAARHGIPLAEYLERQKALGIDVNSVNYRDD